MTKRTKLEPPKEWKSIARFSATKNLKGCWLVDPDGERRAVILEHGLAGQIAAALNLTTMEQRIRYCTDLAGYTKPEVKK